MRTHILLKAATASKQLYLHERFKNVIGVMSSNAEGLTKNGLSQAQISFVRLIRINPRIICFLDTLSLADQYNKFL